MAKLFVLAESLRRIANLGDELGDMDVWPDERQELLDSLNRLRLILDGLQDAVPQVGGSNLGVDVDARRAFAEERVEPRAVRGAQEWLVGHLLDATWSSGGLCHGEVGDLRQERLDVDLRTVEDAVAGARRPRLEGHHQDQPTTAEVPAVFGVGAVVSGIPQGTEMTLQGVVECTAGLQEYVSIDTL
jgi:hypothetical protein